MKPKLKSAGMYGCLLTSLWLTGCATNPQSEKLSCNESEKICYRGDSIDHAATEERFGVEGTEAIEALNTE